VYRNGRMIRSLTEENYFGERAIIRQKARSATVVAEGKVKLLRITKTNFMSLINEKI
jgi:CRP-like cAMP-binding protein